MRSLLDKTSKKKQKLIDDYLSSDFVVGETISVKNKNLKGKYQFSSVLEKAITCEVKKVNKKTLSVVERDYSEIYLVDKDKIEARDIFQIGANPINNTNEKVRGVNYTLSSILFNLDVLGERNREYDIDDVKINELNWNPYIYDSNGNKNFYQRDFVWTLENKQALIDSLYFGIQCGRILVRKRSWEELVYLVKEKKETEIAFNDIVDGKQRLNAIREFVLDKFPDSHGNYFSDLSNYARHKLFENQFIAFAEMDENTPDNMVLEQFLKTNFSGIPQSKEHIKYVKTLLNK
jgi:hypothetical protein